MTEKKPAAKSGSIFPSFDAEMAVSAGQAIMENLAEYQREMSRFVGQRLEKDVEFQKQLTECRSPTDLFEACSQFSQNAVQEYAAQAQALQSVVVKSVAAKAGGSESA